MAKPTSDREARSAAGNDPTRTQVDATLEAAERRYADDPERAEVIARARRFKSSWIELAEVLVDVRQHERYRKWGYTNFEDYYRKELHLRAGTVDKLVGSYAFLRKAAPQVLKRDGVEEPLPSFQSIDFWRKAEEQALNGIASQETVEEVRKAVVEENMPLGKMTRLFKESLFPTDETEEERRRSKEVGKLARKLGDLVGALGPLVPPHIALQVEQAVKALIAALPEGAEDAPENPARAAA